MNREIRHGQWLQLTGRMKRAWGRFFGNEQLAAEGDADIVAGALAESIGIAKRKAVKSLTAGVDKFAATTKRIARSI
jgi:uncharacterized protein YjbJ (UPF0337 family)